MNNIWTIVKKELKRVFTDKRIIFSLFLLPPLSIYLIYGLMGMSAENETKKEEEYTAIVYVVNSPEKIVNEEKEAKAFLEFLNADLPMKSNINPVSSNDLEDLIERLKNQEIDLIIEFPENFVNQVEENTTDTLPKINMYYNINRTYSQSTYLKYTMTLSEYETKIAGTRVDLDLLDVFEAVGAPQGDVEKAKGSILGMILPLLLVIYLMAGAMGIGIESVAGEKERGTIATLLVTPIKRSQLAIGKIISIAIIAVLSSLTSFLGLLAVLPQFAKLNEGSESLETVSYAISDYGMILTIMLATVLFFVALIVIVSTYSKSIKEAGTLVMPLYLVVMGAAFFNMFNQNISKDYTNYLIPIYNVVVALKAAFQFDLTVTNWLITIGSTIGYTVVLIFLIQKMFRNEKIMFNK
ncbi:ABC transporter permease [Mycoplasmatota bacterium]|nr:ABC transporter permease [Mycoplasmatota bacterium]